MNDLDYIIKNLIPGSLWIVRSNPQKIGGTTIILERGGSGFYEIFDEKHLEFNKPIKFEIGTIITFLEMKTYGYKTVYYFLNNNKKYCVPPLNMHSIEMIDFHDHS
jgi:hypothetical protein